MKLSTNLLLPLILAATAATAATAGTAMAENAPLTRAEVKAQLAEAVRTGDILANGETGLKLNEINPSRYPAKPVQVGKTRAQVQAELAEAIRTGDLVANVETGLKFNEINPSSYPAKPSVPGKTRAQVKAELTETQRLGLVNVNDNNYPVSVTAEQAEQIRQAGLRAAGDMKLGQLNRF